MEKVKPYKTNARLIRALLILKGFKIKDLAKQWKIHEKYLSYIINGDRAGYKYRKKLAEVLEVPEELIFSKKGE